MTQTQNENPSGWSHLFLTWLVSLIATLGSLFFSEIMHFPPCSLCWYQRICMYPLVIILLTGLITNDFNSKSLPVFRYSFPIALLGWLISIYHNLVSFGIIPESASPCSQGVSCATKYIQWFGFLTIPLLSFTAFTLILIFLWTLTRRHSVEK